MSTSQLTTHVQHVVERIVVESEHRQKDGGRWLGTITTMVKCQTATDERASQACSRRAGVPVTSVGDGAPALYRVTVTRQAVAFCTDCNRFIRPFEMPKNRVAVVQVTGDERLD